jgi:hypothetical protein
MAITKQMRGEKDTYRAAEAQKTLNALEKKEAKIIKEKEKIQKEYSEKSAKNTAIVV